jgi:hypothetical protein
MLHLLQEQQKNITDQLGQQSWKFKYGKNSISRLWNQTAALAFGGLDPAGPATTGATEEYDGSTWTSNPTGLNTARRFLGGAGTQPAALAFGGGPPNTAATEEFTRTGTAGIKTITVS